MQLSKFTDYALRILMHLAVAEKSLMTTRQVANIHDAKYNHLAKVTQWLVREQYVVSIRGRSGGLRLAKPSESINIGTIVRSLEVQTDLVECMQSDGGNCILSPDCKLTFALKDAQNAFFESLDTVTLADLTIRNRSMARFLTALNTD